MDREPFVALRGAVRHFVSHVVPQHEAELYATDRLPEPLRAHMAGLGLFGMEIPERWGGLGLSAVESCAVIEDLCHGPQALVRWAGPNAGWVGRATEDPGLLALVERYVARMLTGHTRIAFTLTEPGAGSDAAAIRTSAQQDGDEYVLNGRKHLISFAGAADLYQVFAKTDPAAGVHGVTAFLVAADRPGLRVEGPHPKLGLDGMPVGDVVFEDCRVPASHRLGPEGQGFILAMQGLDGGRLKLIAAVAVGAAQTVLEACTTAVGTGMVADGEWAHAALADMGTEIAAARALVRQCAAALDAGQRITLESSACKLFCSEMNDRVADLGVQLMGAAALDPAHPVNRCYREARLGRLWDGTSEIQRLIVARALLRGEGL